MQWTGRCANVRGSYENIGSAVHYVPAKPRSRHRAGRKAQNSSANSPAVTAVATGAPMLAAFGVVRLARRSPYTAVAAGLGLVVYVLADLFMMTLTVNVGLLSP